MFPHLFVRALGSQRCGSRLITDTLPVAAMFYGLENRTLSLRSTHISGKPWLCGLGLLDGPPASRWSGVKAAHDHDTANRRLNRCLAELNHISYRVTWELKKAAHSSPILIGVAVTPNFLEQSKLNCKHPFKERKLAPSQMESYGLRGFVWSNYSSYPVANNDHPGYQGDVVPAGLSAARLRRTRP
ncbi:hypothetical protein FN846DRAFT_1025269 [Sphaerosporella brunnea]|uniref:Uncharacterized protein n=1 Tax=Sphaerosporella brunnea TaxID=1250544 RepID=A0A5J5EGY1_9PEZI|nr:hypothetical protein FN846DRAFT_1025269 [Sphaerosporella brunnea]